MEKEKLCSRISSQLEGRPEERHHAAVGSAAIAAREAPVRTSAVGRLSARASSTTVPRASIALRASCTCTAKPAIVAACQCMQRVTVVWVVLRKADGRAGGNARARRLRRRRRAPRSSLPPKLLSAHSTACGETCTGEQRALETATV